MIAAALLGATGGLVIHLWQVERRRRAQRARSDAQVREALRLVIETPDDRQGPQ